MKRFSKTLPITKGNLAGVPDDKPGVIRMKNRDGEIIFILRASRGRMAQHISDHCGGTGDNRAALFQYRTTADDEEAKQLAEEETHKRILPFAWRWHQRQLRKQHAH